MEFNLEDVKNIGALTKPIIEPIITTIIKPQINRLNSWIVKQDKRAKVDDNFWESKFTDYLSRVYNDSSYLTTLVFPNSKTKIKDLYIPLTITAVNTNETFKIDSSYYSLFDSHNKVVISDYAGMGKSTLLKWITILIIEQHKGVPILIELRKIDEKNSLVDEILNQISPIDNTFDKDLVFELLDLGFFTILFDGFDEIPYDSQEKITVQISNFIRKAEKNNLILTSRPESALSTFAEFQLFQIKPLEESEAFMIIDKLDLLSKAKFGKLLIEEIKSKNNSVKEFLTNPFLVSLLYKSYSYNKDIPSKKITFYEEVYSCLFKHHDLSKEGFKRPKRSRLDIFDFEVILRDIAFSTAKQGRVIYSQDEMIQNIINAKTKNSKIEFKEIDFYEDLTTTVPIFATEGIKIKWAHKSIQDFFAAKYISNHSRKEEIINVLFKSNKFNYLNILDLLYEIEYKLFRKVIIKSILEDFVRFYESHFPNRPKVKNELVDERIALMYGSRFCLLKVKNDRGFDEARKKFKKAAEADDNFHAGATFTHTQPPFYLMNEISFEKQLIKILRIKNEDFFMNDIPRSLVRPETLLKSFKFDHPYLIDDDLSKPYNNPKIFATINDDMSARYSDLSDRNNYSYNLDYKKCKVALELIEKDIQYDKQDNFLLDI